MEMMKVTPTATRPIVVYDGECAFCRANVARIQRRDRHDQFDYLPRSAPAVADLIPALADGDFNSGMRLVLGPGRIAVGADAVYEIARRVPGWRLFAWLYCVPGLRSLFRTAYAWVARNRHRLGRTCKDGTCRTDLPPAHPQESR